MCYNLLSSFSFLRISISFSSISISSSKSIYSIFSNLFFIVSSNISSTSSILISGSTYLSMSFSFSSFSDFTILSSSSSESRAYCQSLSMLSRVLFASEICRDCSSDLFSGLSSSWASTTWTSSEMEDEWSLSITVVSITVSLNFCMD